MARLMREKLLMQIQMILILIIQLSSIVGGLTNASKNGHQKAITLKTAPNMRKPRTIVVGGGPVGLSAALLLACRGYDVTVFEATPTEKIKAFDPALAYLYNINFRGQVFTKKFPSVHNRLLKRSVPSTDTGLIVAPGDVEKKIQYPKLPIEEGDCSYWIPRHEMVLLMWDAIDQHNNERGDSNSVGRIDYEHGVDCIHVHPSDEHENHVSVVVKTKSNGKEKTVEANLVVGADGINSKVRECLRERAGLFETWRYNDKKFKIRKWVTPATGLRLKALQLPADNYWVQDANGQKVMIKKNDLVAVRGKRTGPLEYLSLGSLPVNHSTTIRPANCITRPNHVLWNMKNAAEMKTWFKDNFPRLDLDDMISDHEWERFAKADGLAFPPCQYSPGLQVSSDNNEYGVVLLGDAAHAFSPDIGQGINAGLMDAVQFNEILAKTCADEASIESTKITLGAALKEYERIRAPETRALIRLARFGSPYQYNQPWLKDRIGKKLWTANVIMRVFLNKLSFGIFPKPMILAASSKKLTYRQLVRRADLGTLGLVSAVVFSILKIFVSHTLFREKILPGVLTFVQ